MCKVWIILTKDKKYYESKDSYDVQLISANMFDESDDDWACEELFTTGEDIFKISKIKAGENL